MSYLSIILSPYKLFCVLCAVIVTSGKKGKAYLLKTKYKFPKSVSMGDVRIVGRHIAIGEHTYMNSGHIATAPDASVRIGRWCAIGHNVTILALTHDTNIATGAESQRPSKKGDVIIEDGVWIGSNAIITPGVTIGRQAVVGGNSVVVHDLPPFTVCAGTPCKPLYSKSNEDIEKHKDLIK